MAHNPDNDAHYRRHCLLLRPALLCMVMLMASYPVSARIYRCAGPDGNISYSQTPCASGQTGKRMHGIGSKTTVDRDACGPVRDFATKNFNAIKRGAEPSRLIDKYGGPGYINSLSLNIINFVSGFQHTPGIPAMKVGALAFNKCANGGFGQLVQRNLPPEILPPADIDTPSPAADPALQAEP